MASQIVQVPMDDSDARELAGLARRLGTSRADLIRRACREYVERLRQADLERQYEEGYRRVPEDLAVAEAAAALAGSLLPAEDWT